jgi:DNA-binding transcriptional LysR family regulator
MRFDYDLIDLRLIINVVDTASLTRGAERTHISPPAASARLKKVQESLQTQLFYRTNQGLVPTSAGHSFVHYARSALEALHQLNETLRAQAGSLDGCIRLFVNTLSMGDTIPSVIEKFLLAHPSMNIDLQERPSGEIARALKNGSADIGILTADHPEESLIYRSYKTERLVLIAHHQHPLATYQNVAFAATLNYDYVGMPEHTPLQAFILRKVAAEGIPIRLRIQANSFSAVCSLVESGVGLAIVPYSLAIRQARSMGISIIPLTNPWTNRELHIGVRGMSSLTPMSTALIEALTADHTHDTEHASF